MQAKIGNSTVNILAQAGDITSFYYDSVTGDLTMLNMRLWYQAAWVLEGWMYLPLQHYSQLSFAGSLDCPNITFTLEDDENPAVSHSHTTAALQ